MTTFFILRSVFVVLFLTNGYNLSCANNLKTLRPELTFSLLHIIALIFRFVPNNTITAMGVHLLLPYISLTQPSAKLFYSMY